MDAARTSNANRVMAVKATIVAKLDRDPREDFEKIGNTSKGWIGIHRKRIMRQLVVVQRANPEAFDLTLRLTTVAHANIARPLSFHHYKGQGYVAYEFVDMDLFDILPLYQSEVAAVMLQVMDAVHHLLAQSFAFRVDTIRVSLIGVVKILLDWNFEPVTDWPIREANPAYLAAYLESVVMLMLGHPHLWSRTTAAFVGDLRSGHLPTPKHPFLAQSRGRKQLHAAASFAAQRAVAASETFERDPRRLEAVFQSEFARPR